MIKITIVEHREKEVHEFETEKDALDFMGELIDGAIGREEDHLEDMDGDDPAAKEAIEELNKLDRGNIYELEWNTELILSEYAEVEIEEYNYYIRDLLDDLGLVYDKSTMSKSIYVENEEGILIRISDHKSPMFSPYYGHRKPDIELVYKDGIVDNKDLNKYFNTNLEHETILL